MKMMIIKSHQTINLMIKTKIKPNKILILHKILNRIKVINKKINIKLLRYDKLRKLKYP